MPRQTVISGAIREVKATVRHAAEAGVAAMLSGTFDYTWAFPVTFIDQAKSAPMLRVEEARPNLALNYFGFKITRDMVSDRRVRQAMSIAINRAEIVKGVLLGHAEPAFTYVHPMRWITTRRRPA